MALANILRKSPIAVDETTTIGAEDFQRDYVDAHRPLVIRGAVRHWRAMDWDDGYLVDKLDAYPLQVDIMPRSRLGEPDLPRAKRVMMSVEAFLPCLPDTDRYHYIADINMPPMLDADLGEHSVFSVFPIWRRRTFWWGKDGQISFLHYDDNENIMCQIDGEKVFLLFDVTDFDCMYPKDRSEFRSVIGVDDDPGRRSLADYPLLARATPYIARIGKGDILYLPCYWWHQVTSHGRNIAVSHIINETQEQRARVAGRLIGAGVFVTCAGGRPRRVVGHREYGRKGLQAYCPPQGLPQGTTGKNRRILLPPRYLQAPNRGEPL